MTLTTTIQPLRPGQDDTRDSWALVERAQAGDTDAFADIYRRYHSYVLGMAAVRVGSRLIAEDIAAGVFVRLLRSIGTFRRLSTGQPFGAVLTTITVNMVRDHFKNAHTQRSRPYGPQVLGLELETEQCRDLDPGGLVDTPVHVAELRRDLAAAMRELTPRQARAVRLRYLECRGLAETAAAMGTNVPTIKALTFRAMRTLSRSELLEAHR